MDAHRAAADLGAIEHQVVCLGEGLARMRLEGGRIQIRGAGERVVHGGPALRLGVPLEHRKIDHPQGTPAGLGDPEILTELDPQGAERIAHDFRAVGAEENQIAVCRAGALENPCHCRVAQELQYRRLQAVAPLGGLVHLDVGEAFCAETRDIGGVIVDLFARELAALRGAQRGHPAGGVGGGPREHFEIAAPHEVGDIDELERYT